MDKFSVGNRVSIIKVLKMKLIAPIHVQTELTENCNHHCKHCYNYWRTDDWKNIPIDESKILSIADRVIDADVFHVTLTGGEPFLISTNTLDILVGKYTAANVDVSINSNITLIKPEHIELLKKYKLSILTSIISSNESDFDDIVMVNGAYNRFIKNMNLLIDNDIPVLTNMVVSKRTVDDVYSTGKLAYMLGAKSFAATRICMSDSNVIKDYDSSVLNHSDIESVFSQLLRVKNDFGIPVSTLNHTPPCSLDNPKEYLELLRHNCSAGSSTANICPNGDVKACLHVNLTYGNILDTPLKELWKNMPAWREEFLKYNFACDECVEKESCSGGCRGDGFIMTKNLYEVDPLMRSPLKNIMGESGSLKNIDAIRLSNDLKVRLENEGALLYKGVTNQTQIDEFSYSLILSHYGKDITKIDALSFGKEVGVTDVYVNYLFNNLVNNKLAKVV